MKALNLTMKTFILILTFAFIGISGFTQVLKPEQVPQLIKDRVQFTFPQTLDIPVSWRMEKGEYKASFTIMDTPALIVVDTLGKIKRVERRVNESYLPQKAKTYLKSLDSTYQVVTVMKITDDKEKVTYKTVARIRTNFTFDGSGNIAGKK
jgi:hypothetical protein